MTERRRFLRFQTALNALCHVVSEKYKAKYKVTNISKEGALIVADKPLCEGAEIDISMDVPGDNIPIFASCQVAWQKPTEKHDGYETGLKFTQMNNGDKGRLFEYIYMEWLKLLDKK